MAITRPITTALLSCLIFSGCSNTQQHTTQLSAPSEGENARSIARPFPVETLYALLVAEIAGSRQRYDISLGNYLRQAHLTRDPAIAARATRIARFLNAKQAVLNSATLWVQIEPESLEARHILCIELANENRSEEALEHAEKLQALGRDAPFQHIAAHAGKATDTQKEQLMARYQDLLLRYPDNLEIELGLAILQQYAKQPELALKSVQTFLKKHPDNIPAAIVETRVLQQLKRPQEAMTRMAAMLRKFPDNKRLRLQYARVLASHDLEQAHQQFQILAEQNPEDADLLFSLALVSKERGLLDQARSHFEQLLELERRTSAAHYYLGRLDEQESQFELALQHYLMVEEGQDFMPAMKSANQLLIQQQRYGESEQILNDIRKTYPKRATTFYLLEAQLLSNAEQYQRAYDKLSEGLLQQPRDSRLLYTRATTAELLGDFPGLERDLRTLLNYEPNNTSALNALGYNLANHTNRLEEAQLLIRQALDLKPNDPAIIDSMGWVEFRMGNYNSALDKFERAMASMPDHEIAAHLGEVLWVIGEHTKAKEIWLQGLKLKPDSKIIAATIKRLKASFTEQEPQAESD